MRIIAVIPARYHSTRLPAKPLLDICGKPMIEHVYRKAKSCQELSDVLVATDHEEIKKCVEGFGGKAILTSPNCQSGSDRLAEVANMVDADCYINIQGDEPLLNPSALSLLATHVGKRAPVATLAYALSADDPRIHDPNLVKVVLDSQSCALYFSRSCIPYVRDPSIEHPQTFLAHIGVYAYTKEALLTFASLPPSPLEKSEKLEQLRLLQNGIKIRVLETEEFGPGVDTMEDLERVREIVSGQKKPNALSTPLKENSPQKRYTSTQIEEILSRISLIITDVDGVLTDGGLYYDSQGESIKRFNAKDGLGIVLARRAGLGVAVLSGRDCKALRKRLEDLQITHMRLGRIDKANALAGLLKEAQATAEETAFVGDDITDIEGFQGCALGVSVNDALPQVKEAADIVLQTKGGCGALRELIDRILKARKTLP